MGKTLPLGVSGITDKQTGALLAAYRTNIVSRLADPDVGFSKSFKESVEVASSSDSTRDAAKRGEASGKLLKMLVQAAQSTQNTAMQAAFSTFMTSTAAA